MSPCVFEWTSYLVVGGFRAGALRTGFLVWNPTQLIRVAGACVSSRCLTERSYVLTGWRTGIIQAIASEKPYGFDAENARSHSTAAVLQKKKARTKFG